METIAHEDSELAILGKGKAEPAGTIRLTAPSTFAQLYIAPFLSKFLDEFHGITFDLRFSDACRDLAFRNMKLGPSSLTGWKLAEDTRVLCTLQVFVHRYGATRYPDEISRHRLIALKTRRLDL